MVNKTEALYNALLPMKIAGFDDIMQAASSVIEGPANRKYIYRKYVKRLIEAHKLQAIRKGLYKATSLSKSSVLYVSLDLCPSLLPC
jgi:hypothetical protein